MKYFALTLVLGVGLCASTVESQTFKTLVQFTGTGGTASGQYGCGDLTLSGASLYGMTAYGGARGDGNIFSVGINGANYQNLLSFTGTGGAAMGENPYGSLTLIGTALFGMTLQGGTGGFGNIFTVGTDGTHFQNLLSFTGSGGAANGWDPGGSLTPSGTTFYGVTTYGGAYGLGNVFSVGVDGTAYHNLFSFTGTKNSTFGQGPNGNLTLIGTALCGMTSEGGSYRVGNIFSVGSNGTNFQNLVSFTGTGGSASGRVPNGSLTLSDTTLYGMTCNGGANYDGNIFSVGADGTNYRDLLTFTGTGGAARGQYPLGSLTLSGTTLYGMTSWGGANVYGTIFSVGIDGSGYRVLHDFTRGIDGGGPQGDLTLSGGTLFGMTNAGGANGDGTLFALVLPAQRPNRVRWRSLASPRLRSFRIAGDGRREKQVKAKENRNRLPPEGRQHWTPLLSASCRAVSFPFGLLASRVCATGKNWLKSIAKANNMQPAGDTKSGHHAWP